MASKKSGSHGAVAAGEYQVHDWEVTGHFFMVDEAENQVIAVKWTPGPFKSVEIREATDPRLLESLKKHSKEFARLEAEREAASKKVAAKSTKKASGKKVSAAVGEST